MKPNKNRDYTRLNNLAKKVGLVPLINRDGVAYNGQFTYEGFGYYAPIDLSACAEDEKSILRTAVIQLSEKLREVHFQRMEKYLKYKGDT